MSPTPNAVILAGYVSGGLLRGFMVGGTVLVVSLIFTDLKIAHPWIMIASVFMAAVLFALAGFVNAVYAKKFDDISIIPTFILTPLTYLGGVFYSVSLLPDFWQKVSLANPIRYTVNAFRYGVLGESDVPIGLAFAIMALAIAVLFVFCLRLLDKGVGLRS